MKSFNGKMRLVLHKTDINDFEELCGQREVFFDGFVTDINKNEQADLIRHELECIGLFSMKDQLNEILEKYTIGTVIEILGDIELNYTGSGYYNDDYDSEMGFIQYRERQLTKEQSKLFWKYEGIDA